MFSLRVPDSQPPETIEITLSGCLPDNGGVGVDLDMRNVILELREGTAASRAAGEGVSGLRPGDRVLAVDGESLEGRSLTDVIQAAESHTFLVERQEAWRGFSIDETDVAEPDGFEPLNHVREVVVQKSDGQVGVNLEVLYAPNGKSSVRVSRVHPGTQASACGQVSQGDVIRAIDGQLVACETGEDMSAAAMKVASELIDGVPDGVDIKLELESDMLMSGYMQKRGEKGLLKSWSEPSSRLSPVSQPPQPAPLCPPARLPPAATDPWPAARRGARDRTPVGPRRRSQPSASSCSSGPRPISPRGRSVTLRGRTTAPASSRAQST